MGDRAAGHVARADREVGAVLDGFDEAGQRARVVREVGVDLHEQLVAAVDADREAGAVRVAETDLLGPPEHVDAPELGAGLLGEIGGAVGAVVVDDEHVGVRRGRAQALEELLDVLRLEVRRRHDEHPHCAVT